MYSRTAKLKKILNVLSSLSMLCITLLLSVNLLLHSNEMKNEFIFRRSWD